MPDPLMSDARIFKTYVTDGISVFPMDTIEYEGKFWLVPIWLESPTEEWRTPARLIGLPNLHTQDLRGTQAPVDFAVQVPIPKAVLEGKTTTGYSVIERPPIRFPKPPTVH
jgi:hypothetical protein